MLTTIAWTNEFSSDNGFDELLATDAAIAREIVNRAIDDWESVILDQDYDNDANASTNGVFDIEITVADLETAFGGLFQGSRGLAAVAEFSTGTPGWEVGVPTSAVVFLDEDGGGINDRAGFSGLGDGWFFDQTPFDDAEFTAIVNSGSSGTGAAFHASFVDTVTGTFGYNDFYRTVVHEIGDALGITSDPNAAIAAMLAPLVNASQQAIIDPTGFSSTQLTRFQSTRPSPQFGVEATFVGGHIYEGDIYGTNNDPAAVYRQGSCPAIKLPSARP